MIAILLTGIVAAVQIRSIFFVPRHHSRWLFPLPFSSPRWVFMTVQFAFYGYLLWLSLVFFRAGSGKERVIVAAWFFAIFAGPLQTLLPNFASILEFIAAFGMAAAFLMTVDIGLRQCVHPSGGDSQTS